jgi:hypothetical protein
MNQCAFRHSARNGAGLDRIEPDIDITRRPGHSPLDCELPSFNPWEDHFVSQSASDLPMSESSSGAKWIVPREGVSSEKMRKVG